MSGTSRLRATNSRPPAARAAQPAAPTTAPDLPLQRLATSSSTSSHGALLSLQGTAGNRAVQRLLNETSVLEDEALASESASTFNVPDAHLPAPGGGQVLPDQLRRGMEGALGQDFSGVRMHTDSSPDSVGALAYTQGSDVHFRPGMYQPDSQSGREAIGHELAHVVQQRAGRVATPQGMGAPVNADPSLEAEADAIGRQAARAIDSGTALAAPAATSAVAPEDAPAQRIAAPVQRLGGPTFHPRARRASVEALEQRNLVSGQRGIFEGGGAPARSGAPAAAAPAAAAPAAAAPTATPSASPTGGAVEIADIAPSLPSAAADALQQAAPDAAATPAPAEAASEGGGPAATDEAGLPEGADALAALGSDLPKMAAEAAALQSAVGPGDAAETIAEGGEAEGGGAATQADPSGMTSVPSSPGAIASALGLPPPSSVLPQVAEAAAASDSTPTSVVEDGNWWETELDAMGGSGRAARGRVESPSGSSAMTARAPSEIVPTTQTVTGSAGPGGYEQPVMGASVAPPVMQGPARAPITSTIMNRGTAPGAAEVPVSAASVAPPGSVPGQRAGYRENAHETLPEYGPFLPHAPTGDIRSTSMTGVSGPVAPVAPPPAPPMALLGRQGASRNVRGGPGGDTLGDVTLYGGATGAAAAATGGASVGSQMLFGGSLHAASQVANVAGGGAVFGAVSSLAEAGSAAGAAHVSSGAGQAEEGLRSGAALAAATSSTANAAAAIEATRQTAQQGALMTVSNGSSLVTAAATVGAGAAVAAGGAQLIGGITQAARGVSAYNNLTDMAGRTRGTAAGTAASATAETQRQRAVDGGVTATRGAVTVAGGAILLALGLTNPIGLGLLAGAAIAGGVYALYKWWRGKKNNPALHSTKPEKQAKQDLAVLLFQEGVVNRESEYVAILIELGFSPDKIMRGDPRSGITAGKILNKIS